MTPANWNPRQFSIRELLVLTLIVSIVLMVGVFARRSEHFQAFSTAWSGVSLLAVVAVLAVDRWRLVSRRKLVVASILGYVIALGLPAIGDGDEVDFGVQAAALSFVGLQYLWDPYVRSNILIGGVPIAAPFLTITIEPTLIASCVLGATANLAYFAGIISYCFGRNRPRVFNWSRRAAIIGMSLSTPAIVVMCLDSKPSTFYPGCGLWIASFLALALGAGNAHVLGWVRWSLMRSHSIRLLSERRLIGHVIRYRENPASVVGRGN